MRKVSSLIEELQKFPPHDFVIPWDRTLYIIDSRDEPLGFISVSSDETEDMDPAELYDDYMEDVNG